MARHFLHYWVPETAYRERQRGGLLEHIGSEQLSPRKVSRGDTIWIVTTAQGTLLLMGRVIVGEVVEGREAAIQRLGHDDLWDAQFTVFAERGTAQPLNPVNITPVGGELVFQSRTAPRLTLRDGKVNAQQLQSMRLLTSASADLLQECWDTAEPASESAEAEL